MQLVTLYFGLTCVKSLKKLERSEEHHPAVTDVTLKTCTGQAHLLDLARASLDSMYLES